MQCLFVPLRSMSLSVDLLETEPVTVASHTFSPTLFGEQSSVFCVQACFLDGFGQGMCSKSHPTNNCIHDTTSANLKAQTDIGRVPFLCTKEKAVPGHAVKSAATSWVHP